MGVPSVTKSNSASLVLLTGSAKTRHVVSSVGACLIANLLVGDQVIVPDPLCENTESNAQISLDRPQVAQKLDAA